MELTDREKEFILAWRELEGELEKHRKDFNISFAMEYSSVIDWAADITPRMGHPMAREYWKVWTGSGGNPIEAIKRAIKSMREEIGTNEVLRFNSIDTFGIEGKGIVKVVKNDKDRKDFDDLYPKVIIDGKICETAGIETFAMALPYREGVKMGILIKDEVDGE